jgi:hypothetical protein
MVYINHIFFICSSVGEHLDCFYSLGIVNNTVMNIGVQVSLLYPDLHLFGYMHRSGITESYNSSIFSFLRTLHSAFHNDCTNLHCRQQCITVPVLPHPHQHLLLFFS